MKHLKSFIESLGTPDTKPLMEAVMSGYESLFEGYADVVNYSPSGNAFSKATNFAASINPAMNLIRQSQGRLNGMYTEDEDAWLDKRFTSEVARFEPLGDDDEYIPSGDIHEDSLGLTARDLAKSVTPIVNNQPKKRKAVALDLSGL